MKKKISFLIFLCLFGNITLFAQHRSLYIWATASFISSNAERNRVINSCISDNIEQVFLYAYPSVITTYKSSIQAFISKAGCYNVKVWALDGDREYFSDHPTRGNTEFYNFVNAVVNYNSSVAANERFIGINADLEPHDQGPVISGPYSFHNDSTDSALSTVPGSGVWQSTQKLDREMLMRNWLDMAKSAYTTCHANNLLFGMSMVNWLDNYYSEEVKCTYNAVNQGVMKHMMGYVDDYFVMSYNTTTAGIQNRISGELTYANTLPAASRPRIWGGVETHDISAPSVSYYNHATKNTKPAVKTDLGTITSWASSNGHISFYGMVIHDWINGWKDLAPVSNNTADPGACTLPVNLLSFSGANMNADNLLSWTTIEEKNNDYFVIEYSVDGKYFNAIGMTDGNLNSSSIIKYEYKHLDIPATTLYYRLKQVDTDGKFAYSSIIAVQANEEITNTYLYPSPTQGNLNISINKNEQKVSVKISDIRGMEVENLNELSINNRTISLDVSNLAKGIYWIHLQYSNASPEILKFEKQ